MSNEILMPALSPTMEEGTLAKWLISEGDTISSGDLIAEIETDKATMEVESIFDGTIGKLFFNEGSEGIKVNTPIGIILDPGEEYDEKVHGPNVKSGFNEKNAKVLIKQDGSDKPLDQVVKIEQVDEQKSNTSNSDIEVNIKKKPYFCKPTC
jgi:pyruvate/2-oxoglutarate dehydrogenase complex dihydrolipoamide acyltransferase (E2) component